MNEARYNGINRRDERYVGCKYKEDSLQTSPMTSDSSLERNAPKTRNDNKGPHVVEEWEHSQQQKNIHPPPMTSRLGRTASDTPNLENMIVMCDNSATSFDEITLGEFPEYVEPSPPRSGHHEQFHGSSTGFRQNSCDSPPRNRSTIDEDSITAEQAQEEEMLKLAMERSLQDTGSACGSRASYSRLPPSRHASNSSYSHIPSLFRLSPRKSTNNSVSTRVQTDASTGKQFIWKKGKNGRYIKVPIHGRGDPCDGSVFGGSTASNHSNAPSVEESLDIMEQRMLEEALNRSMAETSLEGTTATDEASRHSYREASCRPSPSSPPNNEFRDPYKIGAPPLAGTSALRMNVAPMTGAPIRRVSDNGQFIWKKGPNNRYIKCPIGLGQVDEEQVYKEGNTRLEQMEEEMFQEAMQRSMRDI